MRHHNGLTIRRLTATAVLCACVLAADTIAGQGPGAGAPARIWRDPGAIPGRDLFWGAGAPQRAPQGPFTFVEEDTGGSQPKISVTDARGVAWDVKFGGEVPAEIASNRVLWALGYLGEEMYFVAEGTIEGARGLKRAAEHVAAGGRFMRARFRRIDPRLRRNDETWTFQKNPFTGTRELAGLVIVMSLINNWDIEGSRNNRVLAATLPGGATERWFIVSDLGATFGRMGGALGQKTKWNLEDYVAEDFIERVDAGTLHLDYEGFESVGLGEVPLERARWFSGLASQLTPEQLRRAFDAAGAAPAEAEGFSKRLAAKIAELQDAVKRGAGARER